MSRMLLTSISILTALGLSAQISVTNATFPNAGDTLRTALDTDPVGINAATPPGGGQTWIFTNLQHNTVREVSYSNANVGIQSVNYPGADLAIIGTDGETYYNKTATKLELMGFAGDDPAGFGLQVITKFAPFLIERISPMNFFDINSQTSNLTLPLSTDGLPDSLLQGIPVSVDSIRVRINTQRLEVVDGWGSCQIPGGTYPVLRQKRTEYTSTGLDVKVPFLGWIDVGQFLPGGGGGLGGFLGTDTTVTYRFYSGTEKEEIAIATMSNDLSEAVSVRFKDNGTVSTEEEEAPGSASIQAYPNPAIEWVRFDCANLPQDRYTLKMFNIIGKVVLKQEYQISGNKSIRIDLDSYKKGTYLYSLVDSKGNIIGTKRLVILKP